MMPETEDAVPADDTLITAMVRFILGETGEDALRDVVCAFVDREMAGGRSDVEIVIAAKSMARTAAPRAEPDAPVGSDAVEREEILTERAVRWCIDHYHSSRTAGPPTRGEG